MKLALLLVLLPLSLYGQSWISLFDGKTLEGWEQKGGKAEYELREGCIVGRTVTGTPNSFLCTKQHYGDFLLSLEFKLSAELNSGIQIRSNSSPDYKNGQVHGYQVEIDPSERAWSGGIYEEGRRGWLFDLKDKPEAQQAFRKDGWNHFLILVKDDRIRSWVNGVAAADLSDDKTASGFIGLQVHAARTAGQEIAWRNIRIMDLTGKNASPKAVFLALQAGVIAERTGKE